MSKKQPILDEIEFALLSIKYCDVAIFKVIKINPDGSGMDWRGHLGSYIYDARRCCSNCCMIFAAWEPGGDVDNGPDFTPDELQPMNLVAEQLAGLCYRDHPAAAPTFARYAGF